MTTTQRYEIEAWLGDDHGLTDDQVTELTRIADEIAARFPDPDDQPERDAALGAAVQLMGDTEPDLVVDSLRTDLTAARMAKRAATAAIQQAALMVIRNRRGAEVDTEAGFARRAGVDRMTVRDWLGLR